MAEYYKVIGYDKDYRKHNIGVIKTPDDPSDKKIVKILKDTGVIAKKNETDDVGIYYENRKYVVYPGYGKYREIILKPVK